MNNADQDVAQVAEYPDTLKLVIEDARARGFSHSIPVGSFPALRSPLGSRVLACLPEAMVAEHLVPDTEVVERIGEFLDEEVSTGFLRYVGIAPYLDGMFHEVVLPELRRKVARAAAVDRRGDR